MHLLTISILKGGEIKLGNIWLGAVVGFLLIVVIGSLFPPIIRLIGGFVGGLVAGFIARGVIKGLIAGFLAGLSSAITLAVLALATAGGLTDEFFFGGMFSYGFAIVVSTIILCTAATVGGLIGGAVKK